MDVLAAVTSAIVRCAAVYGMISPSLEVGLLSLSLALLVSCRWNSKDAVQATWSLAVDALAQKENTLAGVWRFARSSSRGQAQDDVGVVGHQDHGQQLGPIDHLGEETKLESPWQRWVQSPS
jgi:hypothetical protein